MAFRILKVILFSRPLWRLLILLVTLFGALLGILGPYLQKHFIDRLLGVSPTSIFGFEAQLSIPLLIFGAFLCLLISQWMSFLANYIGTREALKLQKQLSEQIYQKALHLRSDSLKHLTIGEIVSVYASDVPGSTIFIEQTLPIGASTLFPILLAPLGLLVLFNLPLRPILLTLLVVLFINTVLAARQARFFMKFKQLAAERVGLVSEWILNIKALKLLGWIPSYEQKIHSIRDKETQNRVLMVTNGQIMNSISTTVSFVINTLAISLLLKIQGESSVTPGDILSLLWILGVFLTRPFRQLPWLFTFSLDGWTSVKRISRFLELKNQERDWFNTSSSTDTPIAIEGPAIAISNLNLYIGDEHLLKDIQLRIEPKEFVAIVGEVGSGKTLLLLSLLGETGATMSSYRIDNRDVLASHHDELCRYYSYIPQEGFVMSASMRDNIAFEYDINSKMDARITDSLEKAQFTLSSYDFPDQLDTEIGERGVNLSGGQKQRLNIARAAFYDSPIILMDDSLSALDVNTELKIVDVMFKTRWKNKTRILATHRLSVLHEVDRIFYIENGCILAQGTLDELSQTSNEFRKFIETLRPETQQPTSSANTVNTLDPTIEKAVDSIIKTSLGGDHDE